MGMSPESSNVWFGEGLGLLLVRKVEILPMQPGLQRYTVHAGTGCIAVRIFAIYQVDKQYT